MYECKYLASRNSAWLGVSQLTMGLLTPDPLLDATEWGPIELHVYSAQYASNSTCTKRGSTTLKSKS